MSEKLRLEAELKDNASAGVRKLKNEIAGVKKTPGMQAVTGWFTDFSKSAEEFVSKGGGAAGTINAMGIGGLTAAASLAEMVKQMKEMGERTLAMKELSRELGLTVDQVNAFTHAGQHFGVSAEAMQSALNNLGGQMPEFRRNLGPLMQELGRWPELIKKLQKDNPSDQLKDIFGFLGKAEIQREPQLQKKLLGAFFGNGDEMEKLMAQGAKGILGEIDKQSKNLGAISPEMLKQAQAFRDAQIGFNDSLEKFETRIGPAFLSMMTKIVDKAAQFFDPDRAAIEKRQREGGANDVRKPNWNAIDGALGHKSSYGGGSGGLFHQTGFGGGDYGLVESIAAGTKVGFLAAYRELAAGNDATDGKGGFTPASYNPGGGGGGGGGSPLNANWRRHDGNYGIPKADGSAPSGSNAHNLTDLINREANRAGIDPRILQGIRAGESGHSSRYDHNGKGEDSWGPMQLNRRGGLGTDFERETHKDLSDPKTIPDQIRWVANYIKKHGRGALSDWHGYHGDRDADPRWGDAGYSPTETAGGRRGFMARMGAGNITDISGMSTYARKNEKVTPEAFVFHHTGSRGTPQDIVRTLNQRHLGVQYVMDRDGHIFQSLPSGARGAHIMRSEVKGLNLSNSNTWGMEVIARDDKDITPAEVASAKKFFAKLRQKYPGIQPYGHGYLNPGHKQATEGATIVNAIRAADGDGALAARDPVDVARRSASGLAMQDRGFLGAYAGRDTPTHVKVEIHDHGTGNKVKVKTSGAASHTLQRWPTNTQPSDSS